jgi:hypothetical protein
MEFALSRISLFCDGASFVEGATGSLDLFNNPVGYHADAYRVIGKPGVSAANSAPNGGHHGFQRFVQSTTSP